MGDQRSLFKTLKPLCVQASQAALSYQSGRCTTNQLLAPLQDLTKTLRSIPSVETHLLDAKLAEYAFFPLSHVFRQRASVPIQALEQALQSLHILFTTGWRTDIEPELGIQLLVLLTFIAADSDGRLKTSKTTDDLLKHDFACLSACVSSLCSNAAGRRALTDTRNIPALGHSITSVLDAVATSESTGVSHAALVVLHAYVDGLDREPAASFLPGILSTLTKVLTPSSTTRRPFKILAESMNLVSDLLKKTLSNEYTLKEPNGDAEVAPVVLAPQLNRPWLTATSAQIKLALGNIVKQRRHARVEIRIALQRLCMAVLQHCNLNLSDSVPLMLDTLVILSQAEEGDGAASSLDILLLENPQAVEHVQNSLHNHLLALPRLMISNDSQAKELQIGQITIIMTHLKNAGAELGVTEAAVSSAIKDSLSSLLQQKHHAEALVPLSVPNSLRQLAPSNAGASESFPSLLAVHKAEQDTQNLVSDLVATFASTNESEKAVRACIDSLQGSNGTEVLVNFWLALQILQRHASLVEGMDDFLNMDIIAADEVQQRDELYAFALSTLTRAEDDGGDSTADWRLRALALEAVTFQASVLKKEYRPELSDALYALLHHLGSSVPQVQSHAMIALNSIARSTGYASAQELIIDNNDYLINGISLKLSTFELSPHAPRVLTMLVRLCGSKILPYLDDLADSIFEALECYHGYDSLVGLLFQCLGAMVEEEVQARALTIASETTKTHRLDPVQPTSVSGLALMLRERRRVVDQDDEAATSALPVQTPQRPWKDLRSTEKQDEDADNDERPSSEDTKAPLTRPYQLIHRITVLTQHHLPSSNPLIRSHLAHVLSTAMPYLAQHEDTFLPLIHTLWPVIVPRLHDSETSVVVGTLNVIAKMAEGAGAFVRGRVADIWEDIRRIHRRARAGLDEKSSGMAFRRGLVSSVADTRKTLERPLGIGGAGHIINLNSKETPSQGRLISTTSNAEDAELTVVSSKALGSDVNPSNASPTTPQDTTKTYINGRYVSTTSLALYRALTSFLIALITNVDVAVWIFDEIISDMLLPYLVTPSAQAPWIDEKTRHDVLEPLKERNADAVWLIQLRHGLLADEARRLKQHCPQEVPGTVGFSKVMLET